MTFLCTVPVGLIWAQCEHVKPAEGGDCKKIKISSVLAGQKLGIKKVDEGIWLVSFMHYDLGYFDLEQKTLQPLDNPFGPKPVTNVSATTALSETRSCAFLA